VAFRLHPHRGTHGDHHRDLLEAAQPQAIRWATARCCGPASATHECRQRAWFPTAGSNRGAVPCVCCRSGLNRPRPRAQARRPTSRSPFALGRRTATLAARFPKGRQGPMALNRPPVAAVRPGLRGRQPAGPAPGGWPPKAGLQLSDGKRALDSGRALSERGGRPRLSLPGPVKPHQRSRRP